MGNKDYLVIEQRMGVMMIMCGDSDFFNDLGDLDYGDYDYTDRNPKRSNENAWFWTQVGGRYKYD